VLFSTSGVEVNPFIPFTVAFLVSFLRVSGAFLLLPFQISVLGYTAPSVSATNQVFNYFYPEVSVAPDWRLGILFGLGGVLGMYLGARTQKFVPARFIKSILCVCVLFVAGNYIIGFFY